MFDHIVHSRNFFEEQIVSVLMFTLFGCHQGANGSHRVNRNQNCDKNERNVEVLWSYVTSSAAKIHYTSNYIVCLDFVWIATQIPKIVWIDPN